MNIEKVKLDFKNALTPLKKVSKIIIHHPAHKTWGIKEIHNFHKNTRGWNGIGYNYLVTFDGKALEGRGRHVGAHCKAWNGNSLGVCFQGNFEEQEMTEAQLNTGAWLIAKLIREEGLKLSDVDGHNKFDKTLCPGKNFKMAELKERVLEILNPKVKKESKKLYKVQIGAFSSLDNARRLEAEAKAKGFHVYIVEE